jgi:hypothetical protein
MESIAYAEKKLGQKMGTPMKVKAAAYSPVKYDVEEDDYSSKKSLVQVQGTNSTKNATSAALA